MNSLKKTIETSQVPQIIKYNYIEEYFTFEGKLKFCNLCNEFDDNVSDHVNSDQHQKLEVLNNNEPMDDKYVAYKMLSLSQTEEELNAVSNLVIACEQAIKLVSDELHGVTGEVDDCGDINEKQASQNNVNNSNIEENGDSAETTLTKDNIKNEKTEIAAAEEDNNIVSEKSGARKELRLIKGVMRAGLLANGLLMRGETDVTMVIISSVKPTEALFADIAKRLLTAFKIVSQNTAYNIELNLDETCMIVSPIIIGDTAIPVSCKILLTSVLMRKHPFQRFNKDNNLNPEDMLDEKSCALSLQLLRRARWFDSKVYNLPHCEAVMKIFRNLIEINPIWTPLSNWALQIIVYRALSSSMETSIRPSQALLRVFEMLASGYLLMNGPGLMDPCERHLTNLCDLLTLQEKENITFFSQNAVRLISSRKMNELLNLPEDIVFNT